VRLGWQQRKAEIIGPSASEEVDMREKRGDGWNRQETKGRGVGPRGVDTTGAELGAAGLCRLEAIQCEHNLREEENRKAGCGGPRSHGGGQCRDTQIKEKLLS